MANELKTLLNSPKTKKFFDETMKRNSQGFLNSVLNVSRNNKLLAKADPASIVNAASVAASLNLSIDPNLGQAYILPFNEKQTDPVTKKITWINKAQLQVGWKGFTQLAYRSGQIALINAAPIYAEQHPYQDVVTGRVEVDKDVTPDKSKKPIGYVGYVEMMNGASHTEYMTYEEVEAHAKRFSKSYSYGPWQTDFDAMAKKTLIKKVLDFAPMSADIQDAVSADDTDFEPKDVTPDEDKATVDTISGLLQADETKDAPLKIQETANANS